MKHALCIIHINDYYSNDLVLNDSNFILFRCDFTYNLLYDITSAEVIFSVLCDVTINVSYQQGQYISFECYQPSVLTLN